MTRKQKEPKDAINDSDTVLDKATDDIERSEAQAINTQEELEPIVAIESVKSNKVKQFIFNHKKAVSITGGVFVFLLILILFVAPVRNNTLGLFMKTKIQLEVYDELVIEGEKAEKSQLSGLTVKIDGQEVLTDAESIIEISVRPGKRTVEVFKENYDTVTKQFTANLSLGSQKNEQSIQMEPNGRPLKISTVNAITGDMLADTKVSFGQSTAVTAESGEAIIVLPIENTKKYTLTLEKEGYSTKQIDVELPSTPSKEAKRLGIVPEGKVYFLSKAEGTVDVVKTDLDGANREVVLKGTGREKDTNTVMVASRDWKYLGLLSARDGIDKLWLINTETETVTAIEDSTDLTYSLYGWSDDKLIYSITNNKIGYNQNGREKLKSYSTTTGQHVLLDQTTRANTATDPDAYWGIGNVVLLRDMVAYTFTKYAYPNVYRVNYIKPEGSDKKTIFETKNPDEGVYRLTGEPEELYFTVERYVNGIDTSVHYEADLAGKVHKIEKKAYYPYLLSPSGEIVVWNERRDGKNTLIIGDTKLENGKEIYARSDYSLYGWYNDSYLLVSKNGSELYITDATKEGIPLKISDYHKVEYPINSYGGGYGGGL